MGTDFFQNWNINATGSLWATVSGGMGKLGPLYRCATAFGFMGLGLVISDCNCVVCLWSFPSQVLGALDPLGDWLHFWSLETLVQDIVRRNLEGLDPSWLGPSPSAWSQMRVVGRRRFGGFLLGRIF